MQMENFRSAGRVLPRGRCNREPAVVSQAGTVVALVAQVKSTKGRLKGLRSQEAVYAWRFVRYTMVRQSSYGSSTDDAH